MRYLLDTHVWLWMAAAPDRLRSEARAIIEDNGNRLFLSAASSWEIAIKHALGRLPLPQPPPEFVPDRLRRMGVEGMPVEHAHALHVANLPRHHRDPFDRLLVAQARIEHLPLITADSVFEGYDIDVVRAA